MGSERVTFDPPIITKKELEPSRPQGHSSGFYSECHYLYSECHYLSSECHYLYSECHYLFSECHYLSSECL